ncbi:MAG: hypothetical protein JF888_07865 [Candidatus Dormibacteraeota bacterium]|uniref:Uncharacterized protein n=1 Tax=Candidatus Dormiibacter inghamiae TaxID=3127013 RepID=A0A934K9P4_9BACT|nr:hypothetical protein [Candidatus Dormibacteraeota bacterium]MBJ7606935.1 hypothetical protein [Candidatus Dormibacteraeota bacterium]PZR65813.1 MAG: hypothetical protein DLM66_14745 [Candidatus Dormibacteraeota bacterium]
MTEDQTGRTDNPPDTTQDATGTNPEERLSGVSDSKGGEEYAKQTEAGHHEEAETGAGRPAGTADARRSTGINPGGADTIDESMPDMPPA